MAWTAEAGGGWVLHTSPSYLNLAMLYWPDYLLEAEDGADAMFAVLTLSVRPGVNI